MTTKRVLITGGAGFIGCNAARFFGMRNWRVSVLDNLSRDGTEKNLSWLREKIHTHGQCYTPAELVQRITGRPLSYEPLMRHLRGKLGALYGCA